MSDSDQDNSDQSKNSRGEKKSDKPKKIPPSLETPEEDVRPEKEEILYTLDASDPPESFPKDRKENLQVVEEGGAGPVEFPPDPGAPAHMEEDSPRPDREEIIETLRDSARLDEDEEEEEKGEEEDSKDQ